MTNPKNFWICTATIAEYPSLAAAKADLLVKLPIEEIRRNHNVIVLAHFVKDELISAVKPYPDDRGNIRFTRIVKLSK